MAISANTNWEVRSTGNDTNGGGFVAGAAGTDWSQQNSPQYSVTDGVTAGTTTITSATANFGTDVVGNIMYVQGGTGSVTAGWYQITARTNSTTITVDRSTGLTAGTGVTLNIGGSLATPAQAMTNHIGQNIIWLKAGTYLRTSAFTLATGNGHSAKTMLIGYNATRGAAGTFASDLDFSADYSNHPILINDNVTSRVIDQNSNYSVEFRNIVADGGAGASKATVGFYMNNSYQLLRNCRATRCTTNGMVLTGSLAQAYKCKVDGLISGASSAYSVNNHCLQCWADSNPCSGFTGTEGWLIDCIASNNTGASSDGFAGSTFGYRLINCIAYANGRHGHNNSASLSSVITNCIFALNGGYGQSLNGNYQVLDYNAYYSNTSGQTSSPGTGNDANKVTLTGDPFVNGAGGNFALNSTAGAGASCKAAGFPGTWGGLPTGYLDIGVFQHQDAGGSSGPVGRQLLLQRGSPF